ncbi:hypothetical protein [Peribacillus butanolivorans]|uniref:hypothetical protein n=1 Tax=Peribacillus butanolivorans TaxID=421767 RepID=UPI0034C67FE1
MTAQNEGIGDRPMIRILEEDGEQIVEPYEVNLKKNLHLLIRKCLNILETA